MRHQAIYNLYSNVTYISDKKGAFDSNGNKVSINEDDVNNEITRLQAQEEQDKTDKEARIASAKAKLEALGLTTEEIKDTFGL
jgi:hypothetical protein